MRSSSRPKHPSPSRSRREYRRAPDRSAARPHRQGHAGASDRLRVDQAVVTAIDEILLGSGLPPDDRSCSPRLRSGRPSLATDQPARPPGLPPARGEPGRRPDRSARDRGPGRARDHRRILDRDDSSNDDGGAEAAAGALGEGDRLRNSRPGARDARDPDRIRRRANRSWHASTSTSRSRTQECRV